jgi:hypothetical protein
MPWQTVVDIEPWNRIAKKNMFGWWEVFWVIKCADVNG